VTSKTFIERGYQRHTGRFVTLYPEHEHLKHYCIFRIYPETYQHKLAKMAKTSFVKVAVI